MDINPVNSNYSEAIAAAKASKGDLSQLFAINKDNDNDSLLDSLVSNNSDVVDASSLETVKQQVAGADSKSRSEYIKSLTEAYQNGDLDKISSSTIADALIRDGFLEFLV